MDCIKIHFVTQISEDISIKKDKQIIYFQYTVIVSKLAIVYLKIATAWLYFKSL